MWQHRRVRCSKFLCRKCFSSASWNELKMVTVTCWYGIYNFFSLFNKRLRLICFYVCLISVFLSAFHKWEECFEVMMTLAFSCLSIFMTSGWPHSDQCELLTSKGDDDDDDDDDVVDYDDENSVVLTQYVECRRLQQTTVGENVCNNSKKRKKSCFFGFWKKRKKT